MSVAGIRHVHLLVAEHERAASFYAKAFGMAEVFRSGPLVLLATPGAGDSLALHLAATEEERARAGHQGGVEHFGFHLAKASSADSVDAAVRAVQGAGGRVLERGEHAPGLPYALVADPDGYAIEISPPGPAAFTPPVPR
jgi:catechol 2,3-dioxygenase-like lactoylglutathione lyase family enzyme